MDDIAKRIKEFIDHKGLSNTDFAKETNLNPAIISHMLSGRNKPSLQVINQIKQRFTNVNLDYLITGDGELINDITNVKYQGDSVQSSLNTGFDGFPMEGVRVVSEPGTKPKEALPDSTTKEPSEPLPDQHPPATREKKKVSPTPVELTDKKEIEQIVIFYTDGSFKAYQ